jgi:molybdate/tungstate transport system permease protein
MRNYSNIQLILSFLGGLGLLFIVGPLVALLFDTQGVPLMETAKDSEVLNSIWLTLWVSMSATLTFSLLGIPLAYILAKKRFFGRRIVNGIIDLPIVIPHTAAGIAILGFVSRDSFVGKIAESLGINFIGNPAGIALAMGFVSIPFLINAARDGFSSIPDQLEKAGLNLGASETRVFFTISIPLASRQIITGMIMMFARGLSEFGAVVIIAFHPMIAPVMIYERFNSFGLQYARPVALIFILVVLIFFVLLKYIAGENKIKLFNR